MTLPPGYRVLDAATLPRTLAGMPEVALRLGGPPEGWTAREVSDGNMNLVFVVRGPAGGVVVKQALPYIRVIGESWPFPVSRMTYEHAALVEQGRLCPGRVPAVHRHDPDMAVMVMELLEPHVVLRGGLTAGRRYPAMPGHVGAFLARTLFLTSDLALPTPGKKALMARFAGNAELCATTEEVIFAGPYWAAPLNRWTRPHLDAAAATLRADTEAKLAAVELKLVFRTATEALVHGDLHTGSVMVTADDTRVIDPEWAFHGPMGFDVGAVIGNLLLAYFAQPGLAAPDEPRDAQRGWLLGAAEDVWTTFETGFLDLWRAHDGGGLFPLELFPDPAAAEPLRRRRMAAVLADAIGFAGAKMIRRVLGISHVEDLEAIADPEARARCEANALRLAREMLVHRARFAGVAEVTAAARAVG